MDVSQAIKERRAYRSLVPTAISMELVDDLARSAQLAPSCYNYQPWRFVFVRHPEVLEEMHEALTSGNIWAQRASMIISVFSRKEDDCVIKDREYHQFDCGIASGFLILRATDLGLVAHPIAGFHPEKTREILGIPDEYQVIALIIVGKHSKEINPLLSERQVEWEKARPKRKKLPEFAFIDRFGSR